MPDRDGRLGHRLHRRHCRLAVGSLRGAAALPGKWVGGFNDRLKSIVIGMTDNSFTDLADRTLASGWQPPGSRSRRGRRASGD